MIRNRVLRSAGRLVALLLPIGLIACDGENLYQSGGTGVDDGSKPLVIIEAPDTGQRVAVGDSVLIRLHASDEQGLASLELSGFAVRGSRALGTLTQLPKFATKTVQFAADTQVRDTIISRYLLALGDSVPADSVYLVARATDKAGNQGADTIRIAIGGPRVEIASPLPGVQVRPGATLPVRLVATDSAKRIQSVLLRVRGQFTLDRLIELDPALARVDTLVSVTVPPGAPAGAITLSALARNTVNDSTISLPISATVLPPAADVQSPTVTFVPVGAVRAEQEDSIRVSVSAKDDIRVDRVGATLLATRRVAAQTDTLGTLTLTQNGDSTTFRIALKSLGVPTPADSSTIRIEITGFAIDSSQNCGAATVPSSPLSEGCRFIGANVFGARPGARTEILLVRGTTARPVISSDRLADLTVDETGQRVFVSNLSRNRVEILPFGNRTFAGNIAVGSEPWGITLGLNRDTLFVANSGGTNISVVPLATLVEDETKRIRPPDIRLYSMEYDVETDSVDVVTEIDYSDRPQFIGQIASGQIIYSTKPTATRDPGTIRIVDRVLDQTRSPNRASEIFIGYATTEIGQGIIVNALTAGLSFGRSLTVCPRRRLSSQADPSCITGTATFVRDALAALRGAGLSDTRLDLGANIESIPLTDTTFVAVSRDNSTVAFGEGSASPGRVFLFQNMSGTLNGSSSETTDLVGNAAERVIGLALNGDGSLGAARGNAAYFFDDDLRQEGISEVPGLPTGGIALHPSNVGYPTSTPTLRLGFISAQDASGVPYIEVVNTFTFRSVRRIYIRDRIVGTLAAATVGPSDPEFGTVALRLYGITSTGVLEVELTSADLQ